jgi:medium-chain acyl-[acyl-carrier-protein] hydrolase
MYAEGQLRTDVAPASEGSRWFGGTAGVSAEHAAVRLFCFAHAGGGATFFRPWRLALAPDIDVLPVILPGRESRLRELPYRRVEQLLEPLCAALEPHLDRPYALFGHSLGSIVAYEVARRLSAGGGPGPAGLLVSGRRAPRLATSRRPFCGLPDAEFLAALGGLGGTPPEVLDEPELVRMLLPALRGDFELNESYAALPGPRLRCPIVAAMGAADPEVDRTELLGWHEETSGDFTMRVFAGGHFYLKGDRPDVRTALRQDLERLMA